MHVRITSQLCFHSPLNPCLWSFDLWTFDWNVSCIILHVPDLLWFISSVRNGSVVLTLAMEKRLVNYYPFVWHTHVHTHTHTYVCTHTHIKTHAHTHTHKHTHTGPKGSHCQKTQRILLAAQSISMTTGLPNACWVHCQRPVKSRSWNIRYVDDIIPITYTEVKIRI